MQSLVRITVAQHLGEEKAGKGIAGRGGIHRLHLMNAAIVACAVFILIHRSVAAQRQNDVQRRIAVVQGIQNGICIGAARHTRALHFVDQQIVHAGKIAAGDFSVIGRGIKGHHHTLLMGTAQDVRHAGDLVLQHDQVACTEGFQRLVRVRLGDLAVGACQDDDAVAALLIHLNDGMTGSAVGHLDVIAADAVFVQGLEQHAAVLAYSTGKGHSIASAAQGDGLVEALAAAELLHLRGGDGLAGADKFIQRIHLVNIQGTENDHFHGTHLRHSACGQVTGVPAQFIDAQFLDVAHVVIQLVADHMIFFKINKSKLIYFYLLLFDFFTEIQQSRKAPILSGYPLWNIQGP